MKAKYLISALAVSTAFVACNNEDLTVNQSVITNGQEIVGEELLGTGLSIYIDNEDRSATRATNSGWAVGDVAGIGWVVKGNPFSSQYGVGLDEVDPTLYANHYYAFEDGGKWTTKSNIYRGWHFAYFPFEYHQEAQPLMFHIGKNAKGENHVFSLKDAAKDDAYKADIINNAPHISAAAFLDASKVDIQSGAIKESFSVERVVNALLPELMISDLFKEDETGYLKNLKIKSVTLNTKEPVLTHEFKVVPKNLVENIKVDEKLDAEATRIALLNNIIYQDPDPTVQENNGAGLVVNGDYERTQTIELTDEFTLAQDHLLRMFIAPVTSDKKAAGSLDFTVTLEDGSVFKVNGTQEENKTAIQRVIALFNDGWAHPTNGNTYSFRKLSYNGGKKVNPAQRVQLQLNRENFTPNFVITEPADWARCVALANGLGESATFTVKNDVVIEFGDDEIMTAPELGVNVVTSGSAKAILKIVGKTEWNNNITLGDGVSVQVGDATNAEINKKASLTINDASLAEEVLVNYATIEAGKLATIGKKATENFTNHGTVIIQWGSFVYPGTASDGDIAFRLRKDDGIVTVNTLISSTNLQGSANVNMFIVANRTWDLDEVKGGVSEEDDRYNPVADTQYEDLSGITVVIEGEEAPAAVVSTTGVDVKNVIMKGANATLTGVNVVEYVDVVGKGTVNIEDAYGIVTDGDAVASMIGAGGFEGVNLTALQVDGDIDASGDVNTTAGINGDIVNAVNVKAVSVSGSVNATGDVNVTANISGNVVAKSVKALIVGGNIETTNGNVEITQFTGDMIKANGSVTVKGASGVDGSVDGSIDATGDVNVTGMIVGSGFVKGANITAEHIVGDVTADGNVTVTDGIYGNVTAASVKATNIQGDVTATNVEAAMIIGDVTAANVNADEIQGNVTATGNVTVPTITGDVTLKDNAITFVSTIGVNGNVTVQDGANVSANVKAITGTLTVKGLQYQQGNTKTLEETTVGAIVVDEGATLNVYGTMNVNTDITQNGYLNVNKNSNSIIYYGGKFYNNGTTKGQVEKP